MRIASNVTFGVWSKMEFSLNSNERRVLDVIWRRGPIARAEIAEHLDITTGPITRITQRLFDAGLLTESVHYNGLRGNPMRPLQVSPTGAYAIGISFSHRHLEAGLVDLAGNLIGSILRPISEATPELIRSEAINCVDVLGVEYPDSREKVLGVGFAVPGDFTPGRRRINAHPYFPKLRDVDLIDTFSAGMPLPVFIENDCNAFALGERVMGRGRAYTNFFCVFVGHGIGGGVVVDGGLYRGDHGNAGGLHSFFPLSAPRPSGHDLFDTIAREGHHLRDFCDFETEGALDLPGVRPWLARAGAQLRDALTITSRLFDPGAIIIGGRLPPDFLNVLRDTIADQAFCADSPLEKPQVLASELGPKAGIVGAASVVLHAHFLDSSIAGVQGSIP
jgi:predicted NBD/HSP70 family sugar kinase